MRTNYAVWIGLFVIAVLVTLAAKYFPYFPGDPSVERWVQSLVPQNLNWAAAVSRNSRIPLDPSCTGDHLCAFMDTGRMAHRTSLYSQHRGYVGFGLRT
jgi:hypothetical protein